MILPYTKFRSETSLFPYFLRPMINIKLINGNKSRVQKAIIDTGADYVLLNSSIAKDLGIDYKSGFRWNTIGIENKPIVTYFHNLQIEILGLENSKFETSVGFINSASVGILLGQMGFFDNFVVKFERFDNCFTVKENLKNFITFLYNYHSI